MQSEIIALEEILIKSFLVSGPLSQVGGGAGPVNNFFSTNIIYVKISSPP
uniref:Uncharacterized protein n=1 Tax=Lepeophtheirus salmonis TaxID=72036 RepID=A0A0K2UU61_LEPSM